jgi:hypothetical protein
MSVCPTRTGGHSAEKNARARPLAVVGYRLAPRLERDLEWLHGATFSGINGRPALAMGCFLEALDRG